MTWLIRYVAQTFWKICPLDMSDSFRNQRKLVILLRRRPGSLNINDNLQQILMRNTVSEELSMVANCKPTFFDNNQLYPLFPVHVAILPFSNPNATLLQVLLNEFNVAPSLYSALLSFSVTNVLAPLTLLYFFVWSFPQQNTFS